MTTATNISGARETIAAIWRSNPLLHFTCESGDRQSARTGSVWLYRSAWASAWNCAPGRSAAARILRSFSAVDSDDFFYGKHVRIMPLCAQWLLIRGFRQLEREDSSFVLFTQRCKHACFRPRAVDGHFVGRTHSPFFLSISSSCAVLPTTRRRIQKIKTPSSEL